MLNEMIPAVLITLDSMKHSNTGLHSFGRSLGNAIIKQNQGRFDLSLYMYKKQKGYLGPDVKYVNYRNFHKLFFPSRRRFAIFHFADQYCRLSPARVIGKKIMTVHDMNQVHELEPESREVLRYLKNLRAKIKASDKVVAISNFVAADIARHFPDAREKISVIYNGTDCSFAPQHHLPAYRPDSPFLFTIGMLCPKKNFHVLVPLLQGNGMKLIISGIINDDYKNKILSEAARFGVSERVIITGTISQSDKDWYYQHCDAFVFPSLAEGFGLPVIEAMRHGKPVFLSKYTSLPEIGGDAAYYFDNFDPAHMVDTFINGMHHFHATNGGEAVTRNALKYTWGNAAHAYLDLYRHCMAA